MSGAPSKVLSPQEIKALEGQIVEAAKAGRTEDLWDRLQPLRNLQRHQQGAAAALIRIVGHACLERDQAADLLAEIVEAHPEDPALLKGLGACLEVVRDIDDLNAAAPDHPALQTIVDRLAAARDRAGPSEEEDLLDALATAARMLARQRDALAEASYRRLVEIDPDCGSHHYNLGLFFKTRGRFAEGLAANRAAARLAKEPQEAIEWNLGICATGAGEGEAALEVWKRMQQKIEIGRFGLPDGGYPQCKVKLAQRPLAERSAAADDPGLEETIWIERLSPCHGIVRSVLYQDLGVDYGDVVLIDGAPVTYHTYGEEQIPVFPHLATLLRRSFQFYDFAGTQEEARQLADSSRDLERDAIVYAHSENYQILCASCWRDPDLDHETHEHEEKHVVTGRIAAPPNLDPAHLLDQLDQALAKRDPCRLYAPDLCIAAGAESRAEMERRRFDMLRGN